MRRVLRLIDYFLEADGRRLVALRQPAGRFDEAKYREQLKAPPEELIPKENEPDE